ncbi:hypothetical protein BGZ76_008641 [Entomortierella beljakovae]|nr:hypothetical protein BGZ76_008641 [Entomortierella beljakovae]
MTSSTHPLNLTCVISGELASTAFLEENIPSEITVDELKKRIFKLIKREEPYPYQARDLTLWKVDIPISVDDEDMIINIPDLKTNHHMYGPLSGYFKDGGGATPQIDIKLGSIEEEFYSDDWSEFIESYVAGNVELPITDGTIPGFPLAWRRGDKDKGASTHRPSLLFFDLPDLDGSYLNANTNSNAREILAKISLKRHSIYPIFGASGCGKTRTVMDMLSLNWGFYFNGSKDDRGSDDVNTLISLFRKKLGDNLLKNDTAAKSITACLLLARVSILSRCLSVSEDEAQILGDLIPKQFQSAWDISIRSILLPFFHELKEISGEGLSQICLVPCGTGLCIYDIKEVEGSLKVSESPSEVLDSPMFKRAGSFPRWDDQAKVKAYFETLDLYLKKQGYSSSASKLKELINDQVFGMLYAWLRGRLRPMISVIEEVIQVGDAGHWKESINQLISVLTDPKLEEPGNLCYELSKTLERVIKDKHSGAKTNANIRKILQQAIKNRFQFRGDFKLEGRAPILVEASLARIVEDRGKEITIIDETIAFQAVTGFLEKDEPGLIQQYSSELFDVPTPPGSSGSYSNNFSPSLSTPIFNNKPKKMKVSKPVIATRVENDNKTTNPGGIVEQRTSKRLANAAQALEDEGGTSKSNKPTKINTVIPTQVVEADEPSGSRKRKSAKVTHVMEEEDRHQGSRKSNKSSKSVNATHVMKVEREAIKTSRPATRRSVRLAQAVDDGMPDRPRKK